MIPAVHHVWKEHYNLSLKHHMLVEDMLHNQRDVQDILARHNGQLWMPDADATRLAQHVDNVLATYSSLANMGRHGRLCAAQCRSQTLLVMAHGTTRKISQSQKGEYHA